MKYIRLDFHKQYDHATMIDMEREMLDRAAQKLAYSKGARASTLKLLEIYLAATAHKSAAKMSPAWLAS
jgi:hypothetical protein